VPYLRNKPGGGLPTPYTKLVSWWTMDETTGDRVDSIGNFDFSTAGASPGYTDQGKMGNAADIAAAEYLVTPSMSSVSTAAGFTFSAWIWAPTGSQPIFGRDFLTTFRCWGEYGTGFYCYEIGTSANYVEIVQPPVATHNEWVHLVYWWDPADGRCYRQEDGGAVVGSTSGGGTGADGSISALFNGEVGLTLNAYGATFINGDDCFYDEIGYWNRVLSSDERAELFNLGIGNRPDYTDDGVGLRSSLKAYWTLEEESGLREDSVGSYDLTDVNTVTFEAGKEGNAAKFTAANLEYLECTPSPILDSEAWTFSAWFKPTAVTGSEVLCSVANSGTSGSPSTIILREGTFARLYTSTGYLISSVTMTPGTWYHYFCSWYPNEWTLSINDEAPKTALVGMTKTEDTYFYLGTGFQGKCNSAIDEVAVYGRALNAGERTALYNSGAGRFYDFNTL
jgi:hypothetical protein